jgi:hypothetical protein
MLKSNLIFYLENVGQNELSVNGYVIGPGKVAFPRGDCPIKCGECPLVFTPNCGLIQKMRDALPLAEGEAEIKVCEA